MILTPFINTAKMSPGRLLKELGDAFESDSKLASNILAVFEMEVPSNRYEAQLRAKCVALRYMQDPLMVNAEAKIYADMQVKKAMTDMPALFSFADEKREQPKAAGPRKLEKLKGPEPKVLVAKAPGVIDISVECILNARDRFDALECIASKLNVDRKRSTSYLGNALTRLEKDPANKELVAKMRQK